jgi:Tfp pilus assembly protein PilX
MMVMAEKMQKHTDLVKEGERAEMKKHAIRKRNHEKGMILAVATIVVIAMLIMATPFLFKLSMQARTTEKSNRSLAAFNLAEAGIDRSLWEMNQPYGVTDGIVSVDETGNGTIVLTNEAVGDRTGTIQGTITTNWGVEPNVRTILSIGGIPHIAGQPATRTVSVNTEKYFKSIWQMPIFGDTGITGRNNANPVNSFDSRKGAYGASLPGGKVNIGAEADMGTNANGDGAIDIGPASEIHGNIASGVGTNVDQIDQVILVDPDAIKDGGEKRVLSAPYELPPVNIYDLPERSMFGTTYDFSTWFTSEPSIDGPLSASQIAAGMDKGAMTKTTLTPADSGVYTNWSMKSKTVTVVGNVAIYLTGLDGAEASFSGKNSNIDIAANSSLTLILGNTSWDAQNSFDINNAGKAEDFLILGTQQFDGGFSFQNNDTVVAAIYAPNASYINRDNVHLYGAINCEHIDLRNNIDIHYDEALGDLDYILGGIPYWRVTTWQEPIGD